MEVTTVAEDDLFFADLSKQISLLIMDDDDDEDPVARCPSVSYQAFSRANYAATPYPFFQEQTYRRESKGTGVFIPQSLHPRRNHNRQGRFSSLNSSKSQKQQQQLGSTRFVSQASYNNNNNHINSFHSKKGFN